MITILIRKGVDTISYEASETCEIFKIKDFASKTFKIPLDRITLSITAPKSVQATPISDDKTLANYTQSIHNNTLYLTCDDQNDSDKFVLGVYFAYSFPIITHVIFMVLNLHRINSFYLLVELMNIFHFTKRMLENKYVHIYSKQSHKKWPAAGVLIHYWFLNGIVLPYEIYYMRDMKNTYSVFYTIFLVGLFLVSEYLNYYCHMQLRMIRFETVNTHQKLSNARKLPRGLFFDQMIAPNYTFESFSWLFFAIFCRSYVGVIFLVLSTAAMYQQAAGRKKHMLSSNTYTTEEKREIEKRGVYLTF